MSGISLSRVVRIGAGAGYSGDRIEPAIELAERAHIDYLVFECLAERTIALAQQERRRDPARGYDPFLEARMRAVLPACRRRGVRVITNAGAANPAAAARAVAEIARELGLQGLRVAAVLGDDVLALVQRRAAEGELRGECGDALPAEMLSANAYLGAEPIVDALAQGADVVITGRVADSSLFLAPLVHEHRWSADDWMRRRRRAEQHVDVGDLRPAFVDVHRSRTVLFRKHGRALEGAVGDDRRADSLVHEALERELRHLAGPEHHRTPPGQRAEYLLRQLHRRRADARRAASERGLGADARGDA